MLWTSVLRGFGALDVMLGTSVFESRGFGRLTGWKRAVHTEKGHFSLKTVSKNFKTLSKRAHVKLKRPSPVQISFFRTLGLKFRLRTSSHVA